MIQSLRSSPLVIFYWLICSIAVAVLWPFMPTAGAQIALLLLIGFVVISTLFHQTELPILATIFLGLMLVNYWLISNTNLELIGAMATAVIVTGLGLIGEKINRSNQEAEDHHLISHWLLLGLISAELVSLFTYWPVSFFNRALLSAIFFYFFWQLFRIWQNPQKRSLTAHFVFVGLAVIVVIGTIIWANFPHLLSF